MKVSALVWHADESKPVVPDEGVVQLLPAGIVANEHVEDLAPHDKTWR